MSANSKSSGEDTTTRQTSDPSQGTNSEKRTPDAGDPGVTPGEAEGDEETVEESIRQHEQKGDL